VFAIVTVITFYIIIKQCRNNIPKVIHKVYIEMMIKKIFIYWAQGFSNAPEVVQQCLLSWKLRNPTWVLYELDDSNIEDFIDIHESIPKIKNKKISKTGYSDIIRIHLLDKYGGCWCDATTFCNYPLDEWLPDVISSGFFAFARSEPNIKTSSWFLYSDLNNYITKAWKNETVAFWGQRDMCKEYFWFHHIFAHLHQKDAMFKKIWDSTYKMAAGPPHFLQERGLCNTVTDNVKKHVQNKQTPVYKLTYKFDQKKLKVGTNLYYVIYESIML